MDQPEVVRVIDDGVLALIGSAVAAPVMTFAYRILLRSRWRELFLESRREFMSIVPIAFFGSLWLVVTGANWTVVQYYILAAIGATGVATGQQAAEEKVSDISRPIRTRKK